MESIKALCLAIIIMTQCGWSFGWQNIESPTASYVPGLTATTNITLSSQQTGNIVVFNGSSNGTIFTLPAATLGLNYTVVADAAKFMEVAPNAADIINFSTATTGKSVVNSGSAAKGDSITLACQTAGQWSVVAKSGTWSVKP